MFGTGDNGTLANIILAMKQNPCIISRSPSFTVNDPHCFQLPELMVLVQLSFSAMTIPYLTISAGLFCFRYSHARTTLRVAQTREYVRVGMAVITTTVWPYHFQTACYCPA